MTLTFQNLLEIFFSINLLIEEHLLHTIKARLVACICKSWFEIIRLFWCSASKVLFYDLVRITLFLFSSHIWRQFNISTFSIRWYYFHIDWIFTSVGMLYLIFLSIFCQWDEMWNNLLATAFLFCFSLIVTKSKVSSTIKLFLTLSLDHVLDQCFKCSSFSLLILR